MREVRKLIGDFHYRLRQRKAEVDSDALAHIHNRARESGATAEQLSEITNGFPRIAEALLEQGRTRRRKPWRGRAGEDGPPALPPRRPPHELPRGSGE